MRNKLTMDCVLYYSYKKICLVLLLFIGTMQSVFAFDQDEWIDGIRGSKSSIENTKDILVTHEDVPYLINSGDILEISVWRESDLNKDVIVRPDGAISVPLIGEVQAQGKSIKELQIYIANALEKYIPEPVVTISTKSIMGNKVFIVGNVNRPGEIVMNQRIDVIQAIGIAGGTSTFAESNDIKILRRVNNSQVVIPFRYGDVEQGKNLEQNILLLSGDVLIVP